MKKYFIDEREVFALNEGLEARVELMGWEKIPIVYIDNFYKNPKLVRDLALRCPPTLHNKRILAGCPARVELAVDIDHFIPVFEEIVTEVYGLEPEKLRAFRRSCMDNPFIVNVTKDLDPRPHIDNTIGAVGGFAALINLNTPKECKGGTAFYTYKGMQVNPEQDGISIPECPPFPDTSGPWELIHLAEMKYNRLIFYPDQVLHGAYIKEGMFDENTWRLVQMYFMTVSRFL